MATKRRLYQPAPKMLALDKRTRKPLVQGRLITDTVTVIVPERHLAQGQLENDDDSTEDPIIQPVRLVPVLTENMSPRPEPPLCLDLSEGETESSIETLDTSRPKPVMVFNVSHVGNSQGNVAVDVVVEYEDSPAKVICHTPGKLERSLRMEKKHLDYSSSYSGGDVPNWKVKVDGVQNFETPSLKHNQSIVAGDNSNLENTSESRDEHYISKHNRSAIKKILKQEIGLSSTDAISFDSEISPSSFQQMTHSGSAGKSGNLKERTREATLSLPAKEPGGFYDSQMSSRSHRSVQVKKKSVKYPQPDFEADSDVSTDLVPVKEVQKQQEGPQESSDSETCSLYEYVTPKKQDIDKPNKKKPAAVLAKKEQQNEKCPSIRKKKTRTVSSRYMQASANKANNQSIHLSKNSETSNSRAHATIAPSVKSSREKQQKHVGSKLGIKSRKLVPGKASGTSIVPPTGDKTLVPPEAVGSQSMQKPVMVPAMHSFIRNESPQNLRSPELASSEQKTSTPTHDQSCHLSQDIDASAIHSLSAMSVNVTAAGTIHYNHQDGLHSTALSERLASKAAINRPPSDRTTSSSTSDPSPIQLDQDYTRYLQWAFLNSKARKMLQDQEKEAVAQINGLWQLVEAKREELSRMKMEATRLKRMNSIYNILGKTEAELETIVSFIPQLKEDYTGLSSALDTTLHQLPTRDIHIPQGSSEEKEVYEERMEASLREAEQLLYDLNELTSDKILPLTQYLDNAVAIDRSATALYKELQGSHKDRDLIQGLTSRLTSLCVQDMQAH